MTDVFRNAIRGARIGGSTVEFRSRAAIAETIVRQETMGEGFRNPLFRAASFGLLSVATAIGGTPALSRTLKQSRPIVVVLADDCPDATGPDGWPQARNLLRWARGAVFHAAGGRAEEYEMIAGAAIICGRLLLVEMELRHMRAWGRLAERELPRLNLLRIEPKEGEHPIRTAPAGENVQ